MNRTDQSLDQKQNDYVIDTKQREEDLFNAIQEEERQLRQSMSVSFSRKNRNKSMDHSKSFNETRELR